MTVTVNTGIASPQISYSVLRSFVPLARLSDEQLDLLLAHAMCVNVYQGQEVVRVGDATPSHIYLLHGSLICGRTHTEEAQFIHTGEPLSFAPIAHEFPRKVSVIAETDCSILKVDSDFLEKLLCWGQVSRCLLAEIALDDAYAADYFWIKKLLESKLFYKVPPTNIRSILHKFRELPVRADDAVILEGEEGSCCYLIKSGVAEVFINAHGEEPVASLSAGAVFGEDALVTQNPRNASVIMHSDGVLLKLEKKDFYELLRQPEVSIVTAGNVPAFLQSGAVLLDVRSQKEFELAHHPKALNFPLHLAYLKSALLDKNSQYITCANASERARAAAVLLTEQGFNAHALQSDWHALERF